MATAGVACGEGAQQQSTVPTDKLGQKTALIRELFMTPGGADNGVWKTAPRRPDDTPVRVVVKLIVNHVVMVRLVTISLKL